MRYAIAGPRLAEANHLRVSASPRESATPPRPPHRPAPPREPAPRGSPTGPHIPRTPRAWAATRIAAPTSPAPRHRRPPRASDRRASGVPSQLLAEQVEHPAPGAFGLRLVVDLAVDDAPAVHRVGIDLDLRRALRRGEGVAQHGLVVGATRIVVAGDRDQIAAGELRDQPVRAVRRLADEAGAMEGRAGMHAVRHRGGGAQHHRPAHAIACAADVPLGVDLLLLVEEGDEGRPVTRHRVRGQRRTPRHDLVAHRGLVERFAGLDDRRLGRPVELIDDQHRIAFARQPVRHLPERRPQPHDVGPHQHARMLAAGRRGEIGVALPVGRRDRDVAALHGFGVGRGRQQRRHAYCTGRRAQLAAGKMGGVIGFGDLPEKRADPTLSSTTPSFPRRRESRRATVSIPSRTSEVLDPRLRGDDDRWGNDGRPTHPVTPDSFRGPPNDKGGQEAQTNPLAAEWTPDQVRGDGREATLTAGSPHACRPAAARCPTDWRRPAPPAAARVPNSGNTPAADSARWQAYRPTSCAHRSSPGRARHAPSPARPRHPSASHWRGCDPPGARSPARAAPHRPRPRRPSAASRSTGLPARR
ncbi:hypothetical protein WR25_20190 [Diploscapter pachys]|uniref:Uncharacterized protein n=1 Tax=Diploscapter pachys TaxID=2018661 RepID=A0A2A2K731_9BILA|nr:hypothetical protein WR25_20190 [Diploscapter pachys]